MLDMDYKTILVGIVMECPFGDECKDCHLQEIRDLKDFEKQVEIIDNMTPGKIKELVDIHYKRRYQRLKADE